MSIQVSSARASATASAACRSRTNFGKQRQRFARFELGGAECAVREVGILRQIRLADGAERAHRRRLTGVERGDERVGHLRAGTLESRDDRVGQSNQRGAYDVLRQRAEAHEVARNRRAVERLRLGLVHRGVAAHANPVVTPYAGVPAAAVLDDRASGAHARRGIGRDRDGLAETRDRTTSSSVRLPPVSSTVMRDSTTGRGHPCPAPRSVVRLGSHGQAGVAPGGEPSDDVRSALEPELLQPCRGQARRVAVRTPARAAGRDLDVGVVERRVAAGSSRHSSTESGMCSAPGITPCASLVGDLVSISSAPVCCAASASSGSRRIEPRARVAQEVVDRRSRRLVSHVVPAILARPAQDDVVRRHDVAAPVGDPFDRGLERRILERLDLSAVVADEVMVVAARMSGLVARDAVAQVDSLHEPELVHAVERAVHAGDPDRHRAADAIVDLVRREATVLLAEELDDHASRPATPPDVSKPIERGLRPRQ